MRVWRCPSKNIAPQVAPAFGRGLRLVRNAFLQGWQNPARRSCSHVIAGRSLFGRVPGEAARSAVVDRYNWTQGALTPTPNRCKTIGEVNDAVRGHDAGGTVSRLPSQHAGKPAGLCHNMRRFLATAKV